MTGDDWHREYKRAMSNHLKELRNIEDRLYGPQFKPGWMFVFCVVLFGLALLFGRSGG